MKDNINFNKIQYFKLLKKQETLKNQETSLFNENQKENLELLSYSLILENQIYYNRKNEYIHLVTKYLNMNKSRIAAESFVWEFFTIFRKDNKALEILEKEILQEGLQILDTFLIHPKSTDFSGLINQIWDYCEFLTFDLEDNNGITLDQFHDLIEKSFFKMKDHLDE